MHKYTKLQFVPHSKQSHYPL